MAARRFFGIQTRARGRDVSSPDVRSGQSSGAWRHLSNQNHEMQKFLIGQREAHLNFVEQSLIFCA